MSDEPVTKTIVGQCVGVIDKPGTEWTEFEINHGGQYTTKVSTKVAKVIEEARAIGSEVATWTFKESNGNPNPHKPGTFYKNRWLDKVEVGAAAPATASSTSLPEARHEAIAPSDKDRAISRLAILKAAAEIYSGKGDPIMAGGRDEDGILIGDRAVLAVLEAADRMERHVYRDIDDVPF